MKPVVLQGSEGKGGRFPVEPSCRRRVTRQYDWLIAAHDPQRPPEIFPKWVCWSQCPWQHALYGRSYVVYRDNTQCFYS